jgi:hypothetical protein
MRRLLVEDDRKAARLLSRGLRTTGTLALLLALIVVAPPARGEDREPVNPDRPGIGTGADTVPRATMQVEIGFDHARERRAGEPTQRRTSLATTLRFGLLDGVELRVDAEPVVALRGAEEGTDVGDFTLGAKVRLLEGARETARPTVSVLPSIKLPTAPDPIGTERPDYSVLGLASFNAGSVGMDLNAGVAAIAQRRPSGYLLQALVVGTFNWSATDAWAPFGEVFYNSPSERGGRDLVGVGAGVVYTLTRDVALDAAIITSLAGRGPDYRLQAGLTFRFGL